MYTTCHFVAERSRNLATQSLEHYHYHSFLTRKTTMSKPLMKNRFEGIYIRIYTKTGKQLITSIQYFKIFFSTPSTFQSKLKHQNPRTAVVELYARHQVAPMSWVTLFEAGQSRVVIAVTRQSLLQPHDAAVANQRVVVEPAARDQRRKDQTKSNLFLHLRSQKLSMLKYSSENYNHLHN